jgi:hypothetical protein
MCCRRLPPAVGAAYVSSEASSQNGYFQTTDPTTITTLVLIGLKKRRHLNSQLVPNNYKVDQQSTKRMSRPITSIHRREWQRIDTYRDGEERWLDHHQTTGGEYKCSVYGDRGSEELKVVWRFGTHKKFRSSSMSI